MKRRDTASAPTPAERPPFDPHPISADDTFWSVISRAQLYARTYGLAEPHQPIHATARRIARDWARLHRPDLLPELNQES